MYEWTGGILGQDTHQNNSCSRANKGVEESTLKREPAASRTRRRELHFEPMHDYLPRGHKEKKKLQQIDSGLTSWRCRIPSLLWNPLKCPPPVQADLQRQKNRYILKTPGGEKTVETCTTNIWEGRKGKRKEAKGRCSYPNPSTRNVCG